MKYLITIISALLITVKVGHSATILDHNFDDGSWGGIGHESLWTLQSSGCKDDSAYCARLEYSTGGYNDDKSLIVDLTTHDTEVVWVEMAVKVEGSALGGSKWVKVFGSNATSDQTANNLTARLEYSTGVLLDVVTDRDSLCEISYNGVLNSCLGTIKTSTDTIDPKDNTWHTFKMYWDRGDYGTPDGEIKIWWDGTLRLHATGINSNPTNETLALPYLKKVEFGGYNDANRFDSTWYLWVDSLYVGTTEKSVGPQIVQFLLGSGISVQ